MTGPVEIPVIDLGGLNGGDDERSRTMAQLHDACKDWGFFWVENHGVDAALMDDVKRFVYGHYEEHQEAKFHASDLATSLLRASDGQPSSDNKQAADWDWDWEATYFIQHRPNTNFAPEISRARTRDRETTLDAYAAQVASLAELLGECVSLNLGLPGGHVAAAFAPPFVGTKVAMYPPCPRPDLVWGLRAHTDAGGIILLLQDQDGAVGGLEFLVKQKQTGDAAAAAAAEWVPVGPTRGGRLFVNVGDQIEVLSGGAYRSVAHRVAAGRQGRRLSVATFYNPGPDAVVAPARETAAALAYPGPYRFGDYLDYYQGTKFGDKDARFQAVKKLLG